MAAPPAAFPTDLELDHLDRMNQELRTGLTILRCQVALLRAAAAGVPAHSTARLLDELRETEASLERLESLAGEVKIWYQAKKENVRGSGVVHPVKGPL